MYIYIYIYIDHNVNKLTPFSGNIMTGDYQAFTMHMCTTYKFTQRISNATYILIDDYYCILCNLYSEMTNKIANNKDKIDSLRVYIF